MGTETRISCSCPQQIAELDHLNYTQNRLRVTQSIGSHMSEVSERTREEMDDIQKVMQEAQANLNKQKVSGTNTRNSYQCTRIGSSVGIGIARQAKKWVRLPPTVFAKHFTSILQPSVFQQCFF